MDLHRALRFPMAPVSDQLPDADDRVPGQDRSHGMRLFGNMYAGENWVFMLIALMGRYRHCLRLPGSVMVAGSIWASSTS